MNGPSTLFVSKIGNSGLLLAAWMLLSFAGCQPAEEMVTFEPNRVYAYRLKLQQELETEEGKDLMQQPLEDANRLLEELFGTPDDPKIPKALTESDYGDLWKLENLKMAAGPAPLTKEPGDHGLYRQLCVTCHGETGNGRGTTAASQNPYPRDFRLGVFKFKSTPRNAKPTRENLMRTLKKGLAGSQMPLFDKLSDQQLNALIDYVIYLSIRGETERELLKLAAFEMDLAGSENSPAERIYDPTNKEKSSEQIEVAMEKVTNIADAWLRAPDQEQEIAIPTDVPVPGLTDDVDGTKLQESIAKGKELFLGPVAACSKCHGDSGKGDGKQVPDYDDWTKEWAKQDWGLAPTDLPALQKPMALGAMKPQPLLPRNLAEGKFRGGGEPTDLYRRIKYGIAGSPMPAAALATAPGEAGLSEADIWHLVNFVQSLSQPVTLQKAL